MTLDDKYCAFCMGNLIKIDQIGKYIKFGCEHKKTCSYRWTMTLDEYKLMNTKPKKKIKGLFCEMLRFKPLKDRIDERKVA